MKNILLKFISLSAFLMLIFSCYEGIDDISYVDPGPDMGAPQITLMYPIDGTQIQVVEPETNINITFRVEDDIEIKDITVYLDGNQVAFYDEFVDYRIFTLHDGDLIYEGLTTGDHILTVTATDYAGNSTTESVMFTKAPPYTPSHPGEMFYMPFDGDFMELVSISFPESVGNPAFTGQGFGSSNAFTAPSGSYLQVPVSQLSTTAGSTLGNQFSATFWYKVSGNPDRAGILVLGDENGGESRTHGLRLFREGNANEQRLKLNIGTGVGESWNDGGVINVADGDWVHVAVTVSETESKIYFNGALQNTATYTDPIDWTGVENLTIGSGGPTFSYWNHLSDNSWMDDLRLHNVALSAGQINAMIASENPYEPEIASETFYMPFDGNFIEMNTAATATQIGSPGFAGISYAGSDAFMNQPDSYLSYPLNGWFGDEFSVAFWYNVNVSPDRAGIVVVGNDTPENRNQGFRIFREGNATEQRIKLNVGIGEGESWNDGGIIDATAGDWVHVAVTVSTTESKIYLNGELVNTSEFASSVDWTGCSEVHIGSGGPTFSYWNHLYDASALDELRFFNASLSQEQIQSLLN